MIRIRKPNTAPRILRNRGVTQTDADKAAYDSAPEDYRSGAKTFKFERKIYAAKSVKNALIKAQHEKCCFCEAKGTHVAYGDVEHFRPKGGFRQNPNDPLGRPGYYWRAYAWQNLFFSCQICNQRYKKNLFPLRNPERRARSHDDDVSAEEALFIDPGSMNPEDYISFRQEYPYPIDGNDLGRTTIEALGLDRETLAERRRDRLEALLLLKALAESDSPEAADAHAYLQRSKEDTAEYASMARAALA